MKSTEEKAALKRIMKVISDLRPLLQDRYNAITPDGFRLVECLDEIDSLANTLAGTDDTSIAVTIEETNVDTIGQLSTDHRPTDNGPSEPVIQTEKSGSALRKGNARERHAQALKDGTLSV